jgi:4-hydroxy-3-methylbut-2-enyl diphosphate reductase
MPNICSFATRHDLILFVCGRKSSNGKVLYKACKEKNPRSYLIAGPDEIQPEWFEGMNSVGICGATSTPTWLMEKCKEKVEKIK